MAAFLGVMFVLFAVLLWAALRGKPDPTLLARLQARETRQRSGEPVGRLEVERIFGDPEALEAARLATGNAPWSLNETTLTAEEVCALAQHATSPFIEQTLVEAMASRSPDVRAAAYATYRGLYAPAWDSLVRLVARVPAIRLVVVEGLGGLFAGEPEPALLALLRHRLRKVRNVAAEALGLGGSDAAIRPLLERLDPEHPYGVNPSIGARAVRRIEERTGHHLSPEDIGKRLAAQRGRLTLAAPRTGGGLSLTEVEAEASSAEAAEWETALEDGDC